MLGKKEPVYLVVWWDGDEEHGGELRHEILEHDSGVMHKFANDRRAEISGIDAVTQIAVFEVKEPKRLLGNLEIVFREGDK